MIRVWLLFISFVSIVSVSGQVNTDLDAMEQKARKFYASNLDSSLWYAQQVRSLSDGVDPEKQAWSLNWTAICYIKYGIADSVDRYLNLCIAHCKKYDIPKVLSKALLNKTINAYQQGDYEYSIEKGFEVLGLFESISDSLGIAHANYNLGLSYHRLERYEEAEKFLKISFPIYQRIGGVLDIANNYNALGTLFSTQQKYDSANHYFQQSILTKENVGGWAYCGSEYSNVAAIYEQKELLDSSLLYYRKSYEAYSVFGDQRGISLVSANLAKLMLNRDLPDSAVWYGRQGLDYARNTGELFMEQEVLKQLSRASVEMEDYASAYAFQSNYIQLKDSIQGQELQEKISELNLQYETEKKEKELAQEKGKNLQQRFWILFWIAFSAILGLLSILFYRRQQQQKKLTQQKLDLERQRISMDLHDHLGAELTILSSKLDAQSFRSSDESMKTSLHDLANISREASAQLRETIWSVKNESFELDTLEFRVREFSKRILSDSIRFTSTSEGNCELSSDQALPLFRTIQEAITNTKKHSEATEVQVRYNVIDSTLIIGVEDNGKGFDVNGIDRGNGLENMKHRMEQMNGTIRFESSEKGSLVELSLPL